MKNIILPFVFIILVPDIFCIENILSKFHQSAYKIKDKRTEVISFDKIIFHNFEMKTFKHNRTTPAHNMAIYPKVNLEDKLEIVAQAYKFLSNEYRYFPIRFQVNFKKAHNDSNILGLQNVHMCGNMTDFYFLKDINYYFCNWIVDDHHFPPLIPNGLFKIEMFMLYLNQEAALFNLYGEVYIPTVYPKK